MEYYHIYITEPTGQSHYMNENNLQEAIEWAQIFPKETSIRVYDGNDPNMDDNPPIWSQN